jgi:hypothetical protein
MLIRRFLLLGLHATWIATVPSLILGWGHMYLLPGLLVIGLFAFLCGVLCAVASWLSERVRFGERKLPGLAVGCVSASPIAASFLAVSSLFPWVTMSGDAAVYAFMGFAIFHGTARPFRVRPI